MIFNILLTALVVELLVALKNSKFSIGIAFAIIVLIPSAIKFNVGINLNSFNLAIALLVCILFPSVLRRRCVYRRLDKIIVVYISFVAVTSLIVSYDTIPMNEYFQNMILLLIEYGILSILMCRIPFYQDDFRWFNRIFVLVCFIVIAYGIFTYVTKFNPYITYINIVSDSDADVADHFINEQRGFLDGRITSTFVHPLQLGQFILLSFSYSFFEFRSKNHDILYIIFLLALFVIAVLTGSRACLVPFILIPVISLLFLKPIAILKYVMISCLGLLLLYPMVPQKIQDSIEGVIFFWDDESSAKAQINGSSTEGRQQQFMSALEGIDDNILLGRGFNFHVKHAEEYSKEILGYESIFLSHLIDGGLIGLFAFLTYYFYLYRYLLSHCNNRFCQSRVHSLCFSFFLSISFTGITYTMFFFFLLFYMLTLYRISANKLEMRKVDSLLEKSS